MLDRPELNTFLVQPPNKDRSQIIIFLGPVVHGGLNKERIFILAEVSSSDLNFKNQIQIFINQLAKKYQELEKENPLIAFENSLEWANRELRENFEIKELGQLSIIFGSVRNEQLQFAAGGNIHAFIFYRENGEYQNNDLIKNYASENNDPNIFFANLISGVIHKNNFTLFATPTVLNYLTLDRVQKIVTNNKTDEICSRLENLLSEIENKVAFGGILLSWPESKEATPLTSSFKLTPNESINRLLKKQKETAQMMSPAVFQSIRKYLQSRKNKTATASSTQEDIKTLKKITKIYTRLTGWQGRISNAWQKILITLGRAIYKIFLFFRTILAKIILVDFRSPTKLLSGLKTIGREILSLILFPFVKIKNKFFTLSLKKRLLLILTTTTCLALIISLSIAFFNQKESKESTNYNQLVQQIKNKITEAEASLIYKNEDTAKQLTKEVKDLLKTLPVETTEQKNTAAELSASLQPLVYKLQKIQTVDSTLELNLEQIKLEQEPSSFIKLSSDFIFFAPNLATIQVYSNTTKKVTKFINEKIKDWQNIFLQKDNTVLVVEKNNTLTQFDPAKETFESKEVVWIDKESQMDLAITYNAKLYSLNKKNNQIYKHLSTTTGFGKGAIWLKPNQEINLSDATSLAIDGNIYVAKQNGQIYKLESGSLNNFEINFIDPILTNITKIYTKNGSDNFFVLDKEKKRVIIWNKTSNKLITQLTNPTWDNLKDFSIDEKERKIYLLNGSTIQSTKY